MANNTVRTRDKFFDAIDETYNALVTALEATEARGDKVSQTLFAEARKGEREASKLARSWVDSPTSLYENLEAMIDAQARAQSRALQLARDSLKGAGAYREEVQEALRRMIQANRNIAEAIVEVSRTGASRAARGAESLPRPRRMQARTVRPSRVPVAEGEVPRKLAG
jgi:hypothetical protein